MRSILIVMGLAATAYAQAPGEVPIAPTPIAPTLTRPLQEPAHSHEESMPVDGGTMAGQVVIGGLFGLGGAFLGGYTAYKATCNDYCGDDGDPGAALLIIGGGLIGGSLAMAGGIKLVGDDSKTEGSYLGATGGAMIGGLVGILGAVAIESNNHDGSDNEALDLTIISASWLAGGMAGYYATRSWKETEIKVTPLIAPQAHGGLTFGVGGTF